MYPNIFVDMNMEKLHEQFICYQLLVTEDIFQAVCENVGYKMKMMYIALMTFGRILQP